MLHLFFGFFLLVGIALLACVLYGAALVWRVYHKVRRTFTGQDTPHGRTRAAGHTGNGSRQGRGASGETVYDTRAEDRKQRKIFSRDEGEYVDYEEEP